MSSSTCFFVLIVTMAIHDDPGGQHVLLKAALQPECPPDGTPDIERGLARQMVRLNKAFSGLLAGASQDEGRSDGIGATAL